MHKAASVLVISERNYTYRNNLVTQAKLKSDSTQIGLSVTRRVGRWQKLVRTKKKDQKNWYFLSKVHIQ